MSPPRFNSLPEWLAYFETLHPKKIDFSLDRVHKVLRALDIDAPDHRIVTVGGTNGKGSCVSLLESVYLAAGYSVGAFTSPHLWRFNERIRIDGREATDDELCALFAKIDAALGPTTLTYFESSAVAAMLMFAERGVDVAILEVGMGGRLDAVNALDADVALIVSIDLDHTDWLGPDRETIAVEKAGIMRRGRPAVIAERDPPASLLAAVDTTGARGILIGRDFSVAASGDGIVYSSQGKPERSFARPRFGTALQIRNAAAVIAVVDSLVDRLPVDDAAISAGIARARAPGRLDVREIAGVEWIFDVAHNVAAAREFHHAVSERPPRAPTLAIFGAMRDKELGGVVAPFVDSIEHWFVAPIDSDRGADTDALVSLLRAAGAPAVTAHPDMAAATAAASAHGAARVLVFGSFYTVGPVMATLGLYCAPSSAG